MVSPSQHLHASLVQQVSVKVSDVVATVSGKGREGGGGQ